MGLILKDVRRGRGALNHLIFTFVLRNDPSSCLLSLPGVFFLGSSVAEWFRAMDMKSGGPQSKSSTPLLSGFVLGSREFNSCVNNQLVSLQSAGTLSSLCSVRHI